MRLIKSIMMCAKKVLEVRSESNFLIWVNVKRTQHRTFQATERKFVSRERVELTCFVEPVRMSSL